MTLAGTLPIDPAVAQANERAVRRAQAAVGGVGVVPAVVLALVGLWWLGLLVVVAGIVLAVLAPGWGEQRAVAALGARPADPASAPRLHNVADALAVAHGLPRPTLLLVEDAAANAVTVGNGPATASLVVTTGLLEALTPIELEGVLAHELLRIERRDSVPATTAAWFPPAAGWRQPDDELATDRSAVAMTRYPPGLAGAFDKIAAVGSTVQRPGGPLAGCWLVAEGPAADSAVALADRAAALREL
ncbi:MAG: M48 family metalloprotease [Acidimicrobiales bacterium]